VPNGGKQWENTLIHNQHELHETLEKFIFEHFHVPIDSILRRHAWLNSPFKPRTGDRSFSDSFTVSS